MRDGIARRGLVAVVVVVRGIASRCGMQDTGAVCNGNGGIRSQGRAKPEEDDGDGASAQVVQQNCRDMRVDGDVQGSEEGTDGEVQVAVCGEELGGSER